MSVVKFRDLPWADLELVRFWDFAATKVTRASPDPDWTAGVLLGVTVGRTNIKARGEWYVIDVRRKRDTPAQIEDFIFETHLWDDTLLRDHGQDRAVPVRVEMEGGSGGLYTVDQLARGRFAGIDFAGRRPRQSKEERARPAATAAERGYIRLVQGAWHEDFLSELELFPPEGGSLHDDQVDALSGAFAELAKLVRGGDGTPVVPILKRDPDRDDEGDGGWQVTL